MESNLNMICSLILSLRPNVSNLVLQKLLYFIQAYSLVETGRPAFSEKIEAWMYGPVVPEAYYNIKSNGEFYQNIPFNNLNPRLQDITRNVVETFADANPFVLVDLTHSYDPWKNAWESGGWNTEITQEDIMLFHDRMFDENRGMIF